MDSDARGAIVIGAGIGGLATAVGLHRSGFQVRVYEQAMPRPWSFDASRTFVERLLGRIVGLRIEVERIEGKFKLNQNHPAERRRKVIGALQQRGDENALAVAALMQAMLPAEG